MFFPVAKKILNLGGNTGKFVRGPFQGWKSMAPAQSSEKRKDDAAGVSTTNVPAPVAEETLELRALPGKESRCVLPGAAIDTTSCELGAVPDTKPPMKGRLQAISPPMGRLLPRCQTDYPVGLPFDR